MPAGRPARLKIEKIQFEISKNGVAARWPATGSKPYTVYHGVWGGENSRILNASLAWLGSAALVLSIVCAGTRVLEPGFG